MIWLIGAGYMAKEYCRVLKHLNAPFQVIGRGLESAVRFNEEMGIPALIGGIQCALKEGRKCPEFAIVATPVECLTATSIELIMMGVKHILIEKPAAIKISDLELIEKLALTHGVNIYIGYNRRFYQSVLTAEEAIEKEGGLIAVNFEISEWAHVVENEKVEPSVKQRWFLANTSHVVDLVFSIAGFPEQMKSFSSGSLPWHTSSSRFVGSGVTEKGVLFSYLGCWDGPGRWAVEFITRESRYILKPMEKLMVQKKKFSSHFGMSKI